MEYCDVCGAEIWEDLVETEGLLYGRCDSCEQTWENDNTLEWWGHEGGGLRAPRPVMARRVS